MTWGWLQNDADRVDATTHIHCFVAFSDRPAALQRFKNEMRRHVRRVSMHPTAIPGVFGEWPIEVSQSRYGYRAVVFGYPFRALELGRLRRWMRRVTGDADLGLIVADTGHDSHPSLAFSILNEGSLPIADAIGDLGSGLVDGTADVARGGGELLRGVGGAAEGLGDAARSVGDATREIGAASRVAPVFSGTVLLVVGLGVFLVASGALKFAPVKIR